MTKPLKLFVLGHARHGKDTVAEIIRDKYGLSFQSSSLFCAELVVRPYLAEKGIIYENLNHCFADRINRRADWFNAIRNFNTPDATRLSRAIFGEFDMYVGLRNRMELLPAKDEGIADLVLWVDAFDRCPQEGSDSITVLRSDAHVIIDNSGTLDNLRTRVYALFDALVGELD